MLGLRTLLEISMRPYLTRKLKEVALVKVEPSPYEYDSTYEQHHSRGSLRPDQYEHDNLVREMVVAQWDAERRQLLDFGWAIHIIARVLRNLKDRRPMLAISHLSSSPYAPLYGEKQLRNHLGAGWRDLNDWGIPYEVAYLLACIAEADFPVSALTLEVDAFYDRSLGNGFNVNPQIFERPCWTSLTTLKLRIAQDQDEWKDEEKTRNLHFFLQAARNASNVDLMLHSSLTIHAEDHGTSALKWLADGFKDHHLVSVVIYSLNGTEEDFLRFLRPHVQSLRDLELLSTCVIDDGCWSKVSLALTRIMLE